jgi:hypothetical protein
MFTEPRSDHPVADGGLLHPPRGRGTEGNEHCAECAKALERILAGGWASAHPPLPRALVEDLAGRRSAEGADPRSTCSDAMSIDRVRSGGPRGGCAEGRCYLTAGQDPVGSTLRAATCDSRGAGRRPWTRHPQAARAAVAVVWRPPDAAQTWSRPASSPVRFSGARDGSARACSLQIAVCDSHDAATGCPGAPRSPCCRSEPERRSGGPISRETDQM